jgi:hypothetical protein
MQWCSNTESVPLLVSNIHDIILVHTQYVPVCTALYSYSFPVLVCTWYVPVRTCSKPVHTKYPVPVMRLTIPDASFGVGHCHASELPGQGRLRTSRRCSSAAIITGMMIITNRHDSAARADPGQGRAARRRRPPSTLTQSQPVTQSFRFLGPNHWVARHSSSLLWLPSGSVRRLRVRLLGRSPSDGSCYC